jgi:octaprenyl-diphosphate synthase
MVPQLARYLIEAGGKRLRPMLTVAAALAFGATRAAAQTNFAAAVEFMHNATLLHDDVVDESDMRRGRPAARMIWGNQASVLVGDYLLGQAFMMMVETGRLDALGVLAKAATIIAEGEVFQLSQGRRPRRHRGRLRRGDPRQDRDAVRGGDGSRRHGRRRRRSRARRDARLWARARPRLPAGRRRARLSRRGGAMGKNTGDDLREGKMTLPVILALADANPGRARDHRGGTRQAEATETMMAAGRRDHEPLQCAGPHGGAGA